MAQDNILQAPAQGFGQDISYAVRPVNPTVLDGLGRQGQTRGGIQGSPGLGGGAQQHAIHAPPPNPTMALLSQISGRVLDSKLKEHKAAAFVSGMQRAAGGEAIQDIADEQPWFSRIFGDSDAVEGARVYTAQARAAEAAAAIEDSMGEVRKMGPEESNAYFTNLVSKHLTGDAVTDASLMQGFSRMLPGTMRRQAKEHYAYNQERASGEESRARLAAGRLLQKRATQAGPEMQTDEEYAQGAVALIAAQRPPSGRDLGSWQKSLIADVIGLADEGAFHAVNAFRSAGVLDQLQPDQRTRVEAALGVAERRAFAEVGFKYAPAVARIAAESKAWHSELSPKNTFDQITELNAQVRRDTGIDRDYIGVDKATGIVEDVHTTLLRQGQRNQEDATRASERLQADGAEAAAKQVLVSVVDQHIADGQVAAAAQDPKTKALMEPRFMQAFRKAPDAASKADLLHRNFFGDGQGYGYESPGVRDMYVRQLDGAVGGANPQKWHDVAVEAEALLNKNKPLFDYYMGKHGDAMEAYLSELTDGARGQRGEDAAYMHVVSGGVARPKGSLNKDQTKEVLGHLRDMAEKVEWHGLSSKGHALRDDQSAIAAADLAPYVSKYLARPNTTIEQATERALTERARDSGAETLGGFYMVGSRGQKPWLTLLRAHKKGEPTVGTGDDAGTVWGDAFKDKVTQLAATHNADLSEPIQIMRAPDTNGVGNVVILMTGNDGKTLQVPLSTADLKNHATHLNAKRVHGEHFNGRRGGTRSETRGTAYVAGKQPTKPHSLEGEKTDW